MGRNLEEIISESEIAKTDGKHYLSLWEHDGASSSQAPYGVSSVHEDSTGRVIISWTDYNTTDGYVYNNLIME